jgi:integrase
MGHIRERPKGSGSWEITYELPRKADGTRRQETKTVKGKKNEAKVELARIELQISEGRYIEPSKMSLAKYFDKWLRDYAKLNINPKTYEEYERLIKRNIVPALGNIPLSKLRPLHLQEYYTEMCERGSKIGRGGLAPQTVLNHHSLLHRALYHAVKWELISTNPADGAEPPTPTRKETNILDGLGMARLIEAARGTRLYIPILIATTTGMRRGEILALRWGDLDFDSGIIKVSRSLGQTKEGLFIKGPKTPSGYRPVLLPSFVVDSLRHHKTEQAKLRLRLGPDYQDKEGLICVKEDGSPYPPNRLTRNFEDFIERLNIPHIRFHDLRHSLASLLADENVNIKTTSERLGHSDVAFTLQRYTHVSPHMQSEAADAIDKVMRAAIQKVRESP